jgi:hypothetical protein
MPTAANITIKKDDGATDVTYSLVSASGGDKSPAIWRNNSATGTPGQRPELRVSSRNNGDNTARRVEIQFTYPSVYTDTATSTTKVGARANFSGSFVMPGTMPDIDAAEFGAQIGNLIAASLIEDSITLGFAPA